jgi:hypothetical protein
MPLSTVFQPSDISQDGTYNRYHMCSESESLCGPRGGDSAESGFASCPTGTGGAGELVGDTVYCCLAR